MKIFLPIIFLLAFPIALAGAGDGSCSTYNSVCSGASINSAFGHGAVELCSDCYRCGEADGICPEDFANATHSVSCASCPDPDCSVTLSGKVYPTDDPALGINDVTITAQLFHIDGWEETYSTTTETVSSIVGSYSLTLPRGNYKIAAEKFGYNTHLVSFPIEQGAALTSYTLDIDLADGSCNADCTGFAYDDGKSYCRAECHGFSNDVGQCFYDFNAMAPSGEIYNIAEVCDNKEAGSTVVLESEDGSSFVVECCANAPQTITRPKVDLKKENIKNLIQQTLVAELEGESSLVKVKIILYDQE